MCVPQEEENSTVTVETERTATTGTLLFACELALVFVVFFAFYMLTLTAILGTSYDSASYTNQIEGGKLFHPQRLLFHFSSSIWLTAWRSVGVTAGTISVLSSLNAVFGALSLCVFYAFLRRRLQFGRAMSAIVTALPAFSYGFWLLSTCVEVDIIPLFFTSLSFYLITSEKADEKTFAVLGVVHGMALLFHQAQCLLLPAILLAAVLTYKRSALPVWRSLAYYACTVVPIVAIPYVMVIYAVKGLRTIENSWYWVTLYAQNPSNWSGLSVSTFKDAMVGFGRCFVGGHFTFGTPFMRSAIGNQTPFLTYLAHNLSSAVVYILIGLTSVLFLMLAVSTIARLRHVRLLWAKRHGLILMLLAWLVPYAVFFFFWDPNNFEFWLTQSVCVWMLILTLWTVPRPPVLSTPRPLVFLSAAAVLLLVINLVGGVGLFLDKENDYWYAHVRPVVDTLHSDDLVISDVPWSAWGNYFQYYSDAPMLHFGDVLQGKEAPAQGIARVKDGIEKTLAQGGKVLVLKGAAEPALPKLQRFFADNTVSFNELWAPYRARWKEEPLGTTSFYVVEGGRP